MLRHKYVGGGTLKEKHPLQQLHLKRCSMVELEGKHSYMMDVFPPPKVT